MEPLFIVTERFHSGGPGWSEYLRWSGLALTEVVSLDAMLCPGVIKELDDEDWDHVVNEDWMLGYFRDLDYLVGRAGDLHDRNLLCVYRNPVSAPPPPETERFLFVFEGYDLVEVRGGASALTNCGGFPEAFANAELSSHGLLPSLERADEVRRALEARYPDEPHARCAIWAIYRAVIDPGANRMP